MDALVDPGGNHKTRFSLLVNGYFREIGESLNLHMRMEKEIGAIVLLFYFIDTFDRINRYMELSEDRTTVSFNASEEVFEANAYGRLPIQMNSKLKYRWSLSMDTMDGDIYIGLISHKEEDDCSAENMDSCLDLDYYWVSVEQNRSVSQTYFEYHEGDIVSLLVDCDRKELSYSIHGKDEGETFQIDGSKEAYYLGICFCGSDFDAHRVTIKDYSISA